MWPFTLSGRLRIIALVGRYLHQLANAPQAHPKVQQLLLSTRKDAFPCPIRY